MFAIKKFILLCPEAHMNLPVTERYLFIACNFLNLHRKHWLISKYSKRDLIAGDYFQLEKKLKRSNSNSLYKRQNADAYFFFILVALRCQCHYVTWCIFCQMGTKDTHCYIITDGFYSWSPTTFNITRNLCIKLIFNSVFFIQQYIIGTKKLLI